LSLLPGANAGTWCGRSPAARAARAQLEAQGFRTFLQRYLKTVRHARKLTAVSAPFFPRYLFIVLDLERDRWRSVNGTIGVAGLITGNGCPTPARCGVVECLLASCSDDGHLRMADHHAVGGRVRLLSGPFTDMVGKLARLDSGGRVQVLLQLLDSEFAVTVARTGLMRA
jgi:transcription antitermination factor NusG